MKSKTGEKLELVDPGIVFCSLFSCFTLFHQSGKEMLHKKMTKGGILESKLWQSMYIIITL